MTRNIRYILALTPLALSVALAGCGGPERKALSDRPAPPPARETLHSRPTDNERLDGRVYARSTAPNDEQPVVLSAAGSRYDVTLEQIRGHQHNHTAVLIDARETEAFKRGHLRGATNLPSSQKEDYTGRMRQDVDASQLIIIYCNGPQCAAGDTVYDYLTTQGYSNMRVFRPGWDRLASVKNLQ